MDVTPSGYQQKQFGKEIEIPGQELIGKGYFTVLHNQMWAKAKFMWIIVFNIVWIQRNLLPRLRYCGCSIHDNLLSPLSSSFFHLRGKPGIIHILALL
jgi:hypothetical protein